MTGPDRTDDITVLILRDHHWFRDQFAELDFLRASGASGPELEAVWNPLGEKLDLHANIEEEIFYPQLLRKGEDDPEAETLDAIGDHNDIRDGVRDANAAAAGTDDWWAAVHRARVANDEHMGEEEHEGLSDFRLNATADLRQSLGRQYLAYFAEHPTTADVTVVDKDPERYVETIEREIRAAEQPGTSLGIGSLRGARQR